MGGRARAFDDAVLARVARGGAVDARRAIDAAARAVSEPLPAYRRAELLYRIADLLRGP